MIKAYIDGACKGNPGIGGWGVYLLDEKGQSYALKGYEENTTNNRMEITAAVEALAFVYNKFPNAILDIYTDSKYVHSGASVWVKTWYKNGWRTAGGQGVKNRDLWMQLIKLKSGKMIEWHWVKSHSGIPGNEMADKLANQAILEGCGV